MKYLKRTSKNRGTSVERTTEPDEIDIEILQQSFAVEQITQKFQKHKNETPREKTQKNPEIVRNTTLQGKPVNTRGDKYNLRPKTIHNDSDSYRY